MRYCRVCEKEFEDEYGRFCPLCGIKMLDILCDDEACVAEYQASEVISTFMALSVM